MRLKLDENLGNRGLSILQAAGHDVFTVALQQLCGATDQELIEKCRHEDRALVSLDLDFANPLRFQPQVGVAGLFDWLLVHALSLQSSSTGRGAGASFHRQNVPLPRCILG